MKKGTHNSTYTYNTLRYIHFPILEKNIFAELFSSTYPNQRTFPCSIGQKIHSTKFPIGLTLTTFEFFVNFRILFDLEEEDF